MFTCRACHVACAHYAMHIIPSAHRMQNTNKQNYRTTVTVRLQSGRSMHASMYTSIMAASMFHKN